MTTNWLRQSSRRVTSAIALGVGILSIVRLPIE